MDRTELKSTLRDESSSLLKSLHPDFYGEVDQYIRELEGEIKKINNPRSAESKMLEDELQSAITDIEVIFIRRLRKITTRATSNAFSNRSAKPDIDKLLPAERKVYDAVLSAINVARNELVEPIMDPDSVRNVATAQKKPDVTANPDTKPDVENVAKSRKHEVEVETKKRLDSPAPQDSLELTNDAGKSDIAKRNISEEYLVVRILKDLSTFQAVDNRKYTLQEHDIVSLPAVNANGLVKRNIAQLIRENLR
ncbi:MAG: hypothetical protein P1P69_02785 [Methanosarcinaceae archaeon]|nr:hypothetical protein [Methanosarcinaceae archaeon]